MSPVLERVMIFIYPVQKRVIQKLRAVASGKAPQFLAEQLTLSQPGGGQIMPITVLRAPTPPPLIFRPCDGPEAAFVVNSNLFLIEIIMNNYRDGGWSENLVD